MPSRIRHLSSRVQHRLRSAIDDERAVFATGALHARVAAGQDSAFAESEFRVFSQWNEDGLIDYLARHLDIPSRTFLEIGVQDYRECNTRFLAMHRNWSGLAVDGGSAHMDFITSAGLDWRYGVRAVSEFVTADSLPALVTQAALGGELGLLSIDVDGIDYWLLNGLGDIRPHILIMEYNALFGADAAITVPYRADFIWDKAHPSRVYFGASISALVEKAADLGYTFVGCESHGVNAFFVRSDFAGDLGVSVAAGFRASRAPTVFRAKGSIEPFATTREKLNLIGHLPVMDVRSGFETTVAAAVMY